MVSMMRINIKLMMINFDESQKAFYILRINF